MIASSTRYGDDAVEILLIEFGGSYPPDTLIIPGGKSVYIKFESRGWSTYSGIRLRVKLVQNKGTAALVSNIRCSKLHIAKAACTVKYQGRSFRSPENCFQRKT